MKNTLLLLGLAGITSALLSFTFIHKSDEAQNPKKERHIKMMKVENGKKMELDTVLTNDDVFVWNGDTILPEKHGQAHMTVDNKGRNENVMILRHQGGKPNEPMIWNMDSGEDMEIVTEDIDSLGKKIVVRKRINGDEGDHMFYFNDGDMKHFAPMPPMPPVPHCGMRHSGQIIDLNDPNVISYKKKELKDGREKIEIIRKKPIESEEMSFDFDSNDQLLPPPPPPAPGSPDSSEIIREYNDGNGNVKIIERSTKIDGKDGKDGKEIKVEVESKEDKK